MIGTKRRTSSEDEANLPLERNTASVVSCDNLCKNERDCKEQQTTKEKQPEEDRFEVKSDKACTYTDYSRFEDEECASSALKSGKGATFPVKLHAILSNPDFESVISWMPHGRSWRILKADVFEEKVLPLFFCHSRLSSFMRQVNGWGFRRIKHGPDYNTYYNELFLRGMPHLTKKMRRESVSTRSKSKRSEAKIHQEVPLSSRDEKVALSMNRTLQTPLRLFNQIDTSHRFSRSGVPYMNVSNPQLDMSLPPVAAACAQPSVIDDNFLLSTRRHFFLSSGNMNKVSVRGPGSTGLAACDSGLFGVVAPHDLVTNNMHQRSSVGGMSYNAMDGRQVLWNPMSGSRAIPLHFERRVPSAVNNMLVRLEQGPNGYAHHARQPVGMLSTSNRSIATVNKEVNQDAGVMLTREHLSPERPMKRNHTKYHEHSIPDRASS